MRNLRRATKVGEVSLDDFNSKCMAVFVRGKNVHLLIANRHGEYSSHDTRRMMAIDFHEVDAFCELLQKAKQEIKKSKETQGEEEGIPVRQDWVKNQQKNVPWVGEENRSEVTRIPAAPLEIPLSKNEIKQDWMSNQKKAMPNISESSERS